MEMRWSIFGQEEDEKSKRRATREEGNRKDSKENTIIL
jgi:hypothetical protein